MDSPSKDVPTTPHTIFFQKPIPSAFTATSVKMTVYLKLLHLEQKHSRMKSSFLCTPSTLVGLGDHNIAAYYKAVILSSTGGSLMTRQHGYQMRGLLFTLNLRMYSQQ